jgi:hypothetical protein
MKKHKLDNSDNHQYNFNFDEIKAEDPKFQLAKDISKETKTRAKSMTSEKKSVLRIIFQNKIYKANGQKFEDLFTKTMSYKYPEFQQIKAYGRIGDMKNDGYVKSKGIYYQVYGPEDIAKSISYAKGKLKDDFSGLLQEWHPVNEFYFIINDKYEGIPAELEKEINKLLSKNKLKDGGVKGAAYLENTLFSLAGDQILAVTGFIPDTSKLRGLDFSILGEVIEYIMKLPLSQASASDIKVPDWNDKIKFNNLSSLVANILNSGSILIVKLDEYLANNGNFLADGLRDKINEIYVAEKEHFNGDNLFWRVVSMASPKDENSYHSAVIVIMSKYFEACDIFERPPEEGL